jgi:hypothetical protein
MLELLVGSEIARRSVADALEPRRAPRPKRERPHRSSVRATSAAALRSLAERLEPSPSA